MKISAINASSYMPLKKTNVTFKNKEEKIENPIKSEQKLTRIMGEKGQELIVQDDNNLFEIENISNPKVGTKFLLHPTDPEFSNLTILFKPETALKSESEGIKMGIVSPLSFGGKIVGSIRKEDDGSYDTKMESAYNAFWDEDMIRVIEADYYDKEADKIKNDYNFFIPSDGDGTRYKDVTLLQGKVSKPASQIPATLNGKEMRLIQGILANFAKTDCLDEGVDFIRVKPAQGSAYAFLEALKDGKMPADKPLVFSWGDNFSDINITKLILDHEKNNAGMTILALPVTSQRVQSLGAMKVKDTESLEVTEFFEKPKDPELIAKFIIPGTEDKCLGSVGPYVLSAQALAWLRDNYIENPEMFKDAEGMVDFSRRIIGNLLPVMANGEIKDDKGNALRMVAYEKPEEDTWSDLGSEKDFTTELNNVKNGKFSQLPQEMRDSISDNIDDNGNITLDKKSKEQLAKFCEKHGITLKNAIVYAR